VLLHRFRDVPLFGRELDLLARERGTSVVPLPGHRRSDRSWLGVGAGPETDLAALRVHVPDIAARDVYVCGPEAWTRLVRSTVVAAGTPGDHVHVETFGW
jgi:ferredoxin-NADP reductase